MPFWSGVYACVSNNASTPDNSSQALTLNMFRKSCQEHSKQCKTYAKKPTYFTYFEYESGSERSPGEFEATRMWLCHSISSFFVVFGFVCGLFGFVESKLSKSIPCPSKPCYLLQCQVEKENLSMWTQLPSQQRTGPTRFQVITSLGR